MEQLVEMGMEEGLTLSVGQMDDLLNEEIQPGVARGPLTMRRDR